jgi:hypothetical protein
VVFIQRWTEKDIEILKNNYTFGNVNNICVLLDNKFSYSAIVSKASKLKISSRDYWSEDEIDIMKKYYPIKTPNEMLELLSIRNIKTITMKACELNIKNIVSLNLWFTKEDIDFIKNNWKVMTDEEIGIIIGRKAHAICDKRCQLGLLRQAEESSYENLSEFIRRNNVEWKKKSMQNCNYKCIITGERFDDIHHTYGLNLILNEVLSHLNIEIKGRIDDYSNDELSSILYTFRIFQSEYPLGVCLKKEIHNKFHSLYGFGNNTIEQWHEFKIKYSNNEFTKIIDYRREGYESGKN